MLWWNHEFISFDRIGLELKLIQMAITMRDCHNKLFNGGGACEVLNYSITVNFFENYRNTVINFCINTVVFFIFFYSFCILTSPSLTASCD